jgi:hypothetical protein
VCFSRGKRLHHGDTKVVCAELATVVFLLPLLQEGRCGHAVRRDNADYKLASNRIKEEAIRSTFPGDSLQFNAALIESGNSPVWGHLGALDEPLY